MIKLFLTTLLSLSLTYVIAGNSVKANVKVNRSSVIVLPVSTFSEYIKKSADAYKLNVANIKTVERITINDQPVQTKNSITKFYEGYTATEALKVTSLNETTYLISLEKDDEIFIIKVSNTDF